MIMHISTLHSRQYICLKLLIHIHIFCYCREKYINFSLAGLLFDNENEFSGFCSDTIFVYIVGFTIELGSLRRKR